MSDKESWSVKFTNALTGGKNGDGWGVSTSGLVVFLIILMIAVIMLIVNAVYFFQVYNGASDADMNLYWSRSGALTLAIFNVIFAVLLGFEFFIVLKILLTRSQINDPSCIKAIGGAIDPITGLPNPALASILDGKDLAYASADTDKSGYVTGIEKAGVLDKGGRFIGSKDLVPITDYTTARGTLAVNETTASDAVTTADTAVSAAELALTAARTTATAAGATDAERAEAAAAQTTLINKYREQAEARANLAKIGTRLRTLPENPYNFRTTPNPTGGDPIPYVYLPPEE